MNWPSHTIKERRNGSITNATRTFQLVAVRLAVIMMTSKPERCVADTIILYIYLYFMSICRLRLAHEAGGAGGGSSSGEGGHFRLGEIPIEDIDVLLQILDLISLGHQRDLLLGEPS